MNYLKSKANDSNSLHQSSSDRRQYESIKSDMKDDYDKRINQLKNRLEQRAVKDPSFWLFNRMVATQNTSLKRNNSLTKIAMFPGELKLADKDRQFEFYLKSA